MYFYQEYSNEKSEYVSIVNFAAPTHHPTRLRVFPSSLIKYYLSGDYICVYFLYIKTL